MNITHKNFEQLVEGWIASSRKPLTPRTQQNYRATLHSFKEALHEEGLGFDSNEKRLVGVVYKWAETLNRKDKVGSIAVPDHQKQRKGKVRRFSTYAHEQGYAISATLLNLL